MKNSKLISIVILIVLLLNTSLVFAETTPAEEFNEGSKEGETFGYVEGINEALRLYQAGVTEGEQPDYVRPAYDEVSARYTAYLMGKSDNYRTGFINGFYLGHTKGFYEIVNAENAGSSVGKPPKVNYGDALGSMYGGIAANQDYNSGSKSNWVKAIPNNAEIIKLFDLSRETSAYRSYFLKDFREKFEDGYKTAYEKNLLEEFKVTPEAGTTDGENVGGLLGEIAGIKDYHDNKKMNYSLRMPLTHNIINDYSLNMDLPKYKEAFIEGFKRAYREKYISGYRDAKIEETFLEDSAGQENGYSVGSLKGEIKANEDYISNKIANWKRHKVADIEVMKNNKLLYQSNGYRQSFVTAYWNGFSDAYRSVYKDLNLAESTATSVMAEIPISGGTLFSGDNMAMVEVEPGTYYNKVVLTVESSLDGRNPYGNNYIKASDFYKLKIGNKSKNFNNDASITLSFEYYGDRNGGIYKLVNNKWEYMNSKIEEGMISTEINPSTLNNTESLYVVFIDKTAPLIYDIRTHWAKDEIQTYIRRGILNGYPDNTFKPDRNLSKGEFIALINRVYSKELTNKEDYIKGIDRSRLNETISYSEIEKNMRNLLGDNTLKWDSYANSMLYNKTTRSRSKDSIYNRITRAEFVYMLYQLNEWKY